MPTYKKSDLLELDFVRQQLAKPKIYLAGKISPHGWRELVVPKVDVDGNGDGLDPNLFNPGYVVDAGCFLYCGPFFIRDDHGCGHGAGYHGVAAKTHDDKDVGRCVPASSADLIFKVNRSRIRLADGVFAYINEPDCFGTLVEIGMAYEMGKPIWILFGPAMSKRPRREMWVAQQCADHIASVDCARSIERTMSSLLSTFVDMLAAEHKPIQQSK